MRNAIFLGVVKFHSGRKNQDFRKVEMYTPPYKDSRGFDCGGVSVFFTPLDSKVGEGIELGAIVQPEFTFDPYSNNSELTGVKVVAQSPYAASDFEA